VRDGGRERWRRRGTDVVEARGVEAAYGAGADEEDVDWLVIAIGSGHVQGGNMDERKRRSDCCCISLALCKVMKLAMVGAGEVDDVLAEVAISYRGSCLHKST
jgi:hypothetical protein